jgi:hypothetical protein
MKRRHRLLADAELGGKRADLKVAIVQRRDDCPLAGRERANRSV